MKKIRYRIKFATKEDIKNHLSGCSHQFVPSLSSYIDLNIYSEKIHQIAITFEAWSDNNLVGLVAVYYNETNNKIGFITNVSIEKKFEGMGIAKNLIYLCIDFGRLKKFQQVDLEVKIINKKAIKFYEYLGFTNLEKEVEDIFLMSYKIH